MQAKMKPRRRLESKEIIQARITNPRQQRALLQNDPKNNKKYNELVTEIKELQGQIEPLIEIFEATKKAIEKLENEN